jgi:hypothetical protein
MEADGQDVRPEPLEERRKRIAKLLSRKTKATRSPRTAPLATSKLGARPPTASARLIVLRGMQPRTINFDAMHNGIQLSEAITGDGDAKRVGDPLAGD